MVKISTECVNQVLKNICPGPSRKKLKREIGNRLYKSLGEVPDEKKYKQLFEHLMEQMYCMLIHAKNGSVEKHVIKEVLSKTMKKSIVKLYCAKFECGYISIGRTKKQSIRDYNDKSE